MLEHVESSSSDEVGSMNLESVWKKLSLHRVARQIKINIDVIHVPMRSSCLMSCTVYSAVLRYSSHIHF